jgi:hypothetical protein
MTKRVISTLAADNNYCQWVHNAGVNTLLKSVLVKGGGGVARPVDVIKSSLGGALGTPEGVGTEVSNEDAEFLAQHKLFQEHQERGFVRIVNGVRDPDTVAQAMETDEGSRPRNNADVEEFAKAKNLGKDDPSTKLQAVSNKKR